MTQQQAEGRKLQQEVRDLRQTRPLRPSHVAAAADGADVMVVSKPKQPLSFADEVASRGGKGGPTALSYMSIDPTSDERVWRALVPDRALAQMPQMLLSHY